MFVVIWGYRVPSRAQAAFVRAYGPDGDWVALFREAPGFRGTELLRVADDPEQFITIDRWDSADAYARFRDAFAEPYGRLDAACDELTTDERHVGSFESLAG